MRVMNFSFRRFSIRFLLMEEFVDVAGICRMDEHSTSETFLLAIQILGSFLIELYINCELKFAWLVCGFMVHDCLISSRFFNLNSNQSIVNKTIPLLVARRGFVLHFFAIKPYGESIVKIYSIFFSHH